MEASKGTLYLVATPIGNLEDITLRALRVLREADLVAAEDTRVSRKLLSHYDIHVRLVSCRAHNEVRQADALVEELLAGRDVAYVSDAGMPGISDPGERLVERALLRGIEVRCIPGPSAGLCALAVSGLPARRFVFEGFLPRARAEKARQLAQLRSETRTLIFYVSPHRLSADLEALAETLGDRPAALCRELTKMHEETRRETLSSLLAVSRTDPPRGEMVLVVEGDRAPEAFPLAAAMGEMQKLVEAGLGTRKAAVLVGDMRQLSKKTLYDTYLRERDSATEEEEGSS